MKKPKVVIIDDDPLVRKTLKELFERRVRKETGIEYNIKTYEKCPEDVNEITDATLYLIDYFLPEKKGDEIAKTLMEKNAEGERVLITGNLPDAVQDMGELEKKGFFDKTSEDRAKTVEAWYNGGGTTLFPRLLTKPINSESLVSLVSKLRNERKIRAPLNIGIVGLGRFGREIIERATKGNWVSKINVHSDFFNLHSKEYEEYSKVIGQITRHERLEELLESNPDVLFITKGVRSERVIKRDKMFDESAKLLFPKLKIIRESKFKNPIIIGTNPVGPLIKLGQELGIDPRQLIGEGVTDTLRTRRLLAEGDYLPEKINDIYDIQINVLGTHAIPVPIFSTATIKGNPLVKIANYEEFRERFVQELRGIGKRIMKGANKIGSYSDAPDSAMEMAYDLATFSRTPRSCWMMYNDQTGFYVTNSPVEIEYNETPLIKQIKVEDLDSWEKNELRKQEKEFSIQRNKVRKFLKGK